uniref:IRG-type G domain-containing protein n=1 Tax=Lotharella oceanica TaxID=641309 RepID=A0A7S2TRG9_9EUKA
MASRATAGFRPAVNAPGRVLRGNNRLPACNRMVQRRQPLQPVRVESDYWLRGQSASVVDATQAEEFGNMDAEFWNDVVRRDSRGLPEDVSTAVSTSAKELQSILGEFANGPRMLSLAFELDPMPWWTFSDLYMRLNILKEYGEASYGEKNVLLIDDSLDYQREPIDLGPNWVVGRISECDYLDFSGAKHLFVYGADISNPNMLEGAIGQASKTAKGDLICINCKFGYIGDPDGRAMRARAKEWFHGGMDTVDLLMFPVHKLDEECRGSSADLMGDETLAYPMPQWLKEAGYKGTANMAISGCSGTGKSSFMNAMRGIEAGDEGAAAVGNIETTMIATPYTFTDAACALMSEGQSCSGASHFRLWDLPGAGTPKFPLNSYLRVMGIKYFDLVTVIAAGRYTETDLTLMKEMARNNVPFFAVRTKIDLEIENAEWDMGMSEAETMDVIREDLRMNTGLPDDRIFLLSSREPDKYDFPKLKAAMNRIMQSGIEDKVDRALRRKLFTRRYFNTLVNVDDFQHADA